MKTILKLISAILCVVMVLTTTLTSTVFADKDTLFDLKSLGILGGFDLKTT